ncbi:1,4-alpha-glucan branching protein GlgB [Clostridium sp. 'White wine YQ']|uniref:1,4-alpha-glucan branching protein GlgB n=1 Tax=Clostridium sp. 'White wine YQ' TaxID=3027474 RepID=UPI002366803B|nr:1,4-alpha-glucan branching protein GlgB [Clostridium sp. 'White wine YQ']MDD7796430.1 1,4-alpha-glucan branching protein GlgB [Clostridium sp. 'White wine YQ']
MREIIEIDKHEINNSSEEKNSNTDIQENKEESRTITEWITDYDAYLFHQGNHYNAYKFMGAHLVTENRKKGVRFTTWAPNASEVYIVGNFNNWQISKEYAMNKVTKSGIWSTFIPGKFENEIYKYLIINKRNHKKVMKADPYGTSSELRPNTASIVVSNSKYRWRDKRWINKKNKANVYRSPINIYELHLGSWKRKESGEFFTYKEMAIEAPKYVKEMGYTHVEIMPVMEHPLDDSWGYQVTGYYAPTCRYGTREEFKELVDSFHNEGIGVILDWVPGHFCKDAHGLYMFDGEAVYEYKDLFRQENKGWGAANFDLGKNEVKSFLISNALYWMREFHIDGLRVDAVANMLYLDYDRGPGEWVPNKYGGKESLEAIKFLRELNTAVFREFPNNLMIAEESTSWPLVTKPADVGGLGFNFKWNMGWMNDILKYVSIDPLYRKYNHNLINFPMMYHYSENFILPISHDEVVHGKKSMVDKMWGDYWTKFAGLRVFMGFMMTHPGKKTIFMGNEFGQFVEWRHKEALDWHLIENYDMHRNTHRFFKDINNLYINQKALWELDYDHSGFRWIDADNSEQSILIYVRNGVKERDTLIVVCNFTTCEYDNYKIGVPYLGEYKEIFNSDNELYGGTGKITEQTILSVKGNWHKEAYFLNIKVPPMAVVVIKLEKLIRLEAKNTSSSNLKKEKNKDKEELL